MIHNFTIEGKPHRLRRMESNSGVSMAGRSGFRRWLLEHRGANIWVQDGFVVLPNDAGVEDACKQWGIDPPTRKEG